MNGDDDRIPLMPKTYGGEGISGVFYRIPLMLKTYGNDDDALVRDGDDQIPLMPMTYGNGDDDEHLSCGALQVHDGDDRKMMI